MMSTKTWTSYTHYTKGNHGLMMRTVYSKDGSDDDEGDEEQYDCEDDGDDENDGDEFDDGKSS